MGPVSPPPHRLFRFGAFELDTGDGELRKHGRRLHLQDQPLKILMALLERPGEIVTREELVRTIWPEGVFVDFERGLNAAVTRLRQTLGDSAGQPRYVETVARKGYRFVSQVNWSDGAPPPRVLQPPAVEERVDQHASEPVRAGREANAPANGLGNASLATKGRGIYLVCAIVATISIATILWALKDRPPMGARPQNPQPLTSHAGVQQHPSLSPDGSQVAYSWDGPDGDNFDIYVKLVGPGEPVRLTTNPGRDVQPAWSPDGRQIAFIRFSSRERGSILLIPALKGAERKLADFATTAPASRLSWSPDGRSLAFGGKLTESGGSGIWLLSVDGNTPPHRITTAGDFPRFDFGPAFSPEGRSLAFIRARAYNDTDLYVQHLSEALAPSGEPQRLTSSEVSIASIAWVNDRKLIYCAGQTDALRRLQTVELATGGGGTQPESAGFGEGAQSVSVSRGGTLIYSLLEQDVDLWQSDLSGRSAGSRKLAPSRYQNWTPAWSHDGRRLAFASTRSGIEEIWVANADGSQPIQVSHMGSGHTANPRWSRDDRVILFNSWTPRSHLHTVNVADGSMTQLTRDQADDLEAIWSHDGKWIYCGSNRSGRFEISRLPATGGTAVPITKNGGVHAEESPDGRWLYYSKDLESPTAIWKVPRNGGEESPVVDGLTYSNNFAVSEKGIYFVSGRFGPSGGAQRNGNAIEFYDFATGKRMVLSVLQAAVFWGVALSPDQRSFVYPMIDHTASNLMLIENFR